MSVLALDNGQNRNQGNTTVNVTITDKNNKNPVFDPLSAVEVGENAAIGTGTGYSVKILLIGSYSTYSISSL